MSPRGTRKRPAVFDEATVARVIREGMARGEPPEAIARTVIALTEDSLAVRAYTHPLRRAILRELRAAGALSPKDITARVDDESLSAVAYHVRELERYGLIELCGTRPRRGATEHFYRVAGSDAQPSSQAATPPKSGAPGGYLTVAEAARRVGVTGQSIRNWITAGRLTATRREGRLVVARSELEAVSQDRRVVRGRGR